MGRNPRLAFAPEARQALGRGFNLLTDMMAVALGPRGRRVAVARDNPRRPPELLDDGATIARRFLGLPNRWETMGAFLARHIAWRMEEAVGDGATTAVIIARQVLNEIERLVAAGYNPMPIRRGIERGLQAILQTLTTLAHPLNDPQHIRGLATTITGDATLGDYIEEIFDTVGPYGAIDVRTNYARVHDRQYIQGTMWNQGWASSYFTTEGGTAILKNPYLLLTNRHLTQASELAPIMARIRETGSDRGLVVLANGIEKEALAILVANKTRGILPTLAIKTPGLGDEKDEILLDLAVLCGGTVFRQESNHRLENAQLSDLGQAEEVQAIRSGFTLIGGKGRPATIRKRYQTVREQIPNATGRERDRLVERAGKLLGGIGLLKIGGATESEQEYLKDRAKEAVQVVRLGMQEGVVPGGGVAYLQCLAALDQLTFTPEEAPARNVLRSALLAPLQTILRNSGYEVAPIVAQVQQAGSGCGFDVQRGQLVDMVDARIVDPVTVLANALKIGVSGALMGITTEVLVHRPRHNRDEEVDFQP
jgi:chaperonin GroEL